MTLVEQLRSRLVTVPKPGTKPYRPHGAVHCTISGIPPKAGADAGILSASTVQAPIGEWWVQEHVYAVEPLSAQAANRIEQLEAALKYIESHSNNWTRDYARHALGIKTAQQLDRFPNNETLKRKIASDPDDDPSVP